MVKRTILALAILTFLLNFVSATAAPNLDGGG